MNLPVTHFLHEPWHHVNASHTPLGQTPFFEKCLLLPLGTAIRLASSGGGGGGGSSSRNVREETGSWRFIALVYVCKETRLRCIGRCCVGIVRASEKACAGCREVHYYCFGFRVRKETCAKCRGRCCVGYTCASEETYAGRNGIRCLGST